MEKLYLGNCLDVMKSIPDKSIDMILCDLPYGTTACKWDTIIPFEPLWEQYKRIIKDNGAIVLTASQPFTSALVMSNVDWFKYEWIWEKDGGSNFATVKYMPMKEHENVLVFGKGTIKYNQQKQERIGSRKGKKTTSFQTDSDGVYGKIKGVGKFEVEELRCPRSIQRFTRERGQHPTQKPVALFEYLIKTYTNEGDLVLDNTAGSGTTGVACKNTNRNFILIEKDPDYCKIIEARVGVKAETINKRYLADNKMLEQEIIYQKEDNEALNKAIDKKQSNCSCGGRIVKTKSGVLTCEDCFETY